MLKLHIRAEDVPGSWTWTGRRWQAGASWIEPYDHPALEIIDQNSDSPALVVRERCPGLDRQPHHLGWDGDFVTVQFTGDSVWIQAGERGIAPIYLLEHAGTLYGSWDVADLAEHLRQAPLQEREIARQLTGRYRYTHETLWNGLYWLTERSWAVFGRRGLDLCYPLAAAHGRPRHLHPDADPIAAYEQLLDQVLDRHAYEPATTAVELSGGLDSTNVAAVLGARHPDKITAAAMLIVGPAGIQQQDRRRRMIDMLRLGVDVTTRMVDNLPLRPGGRRASRALITPYDELYDEGKHSLLTLLAERGIRTLVTGIGGDEMVALTLDELPRQAVGVDKPPAEWIGPRTRELLDDLETGTAPAAVVNEMTLLSMACVAPPVLRAGMWPVHPLADPALIRFGEWLPYPWRHRKELHRARLTRIGCDPYLTDPPLRENFEQVMSLGLRRYGVDFLQTMLDHGLPLIDGGYIDPDGLTTTMERIAAGTATPADHDICGVFVAEATLRSYGHADSLATVAATATTPA
ncbi:asparagine synthase-related protein [Actinoplanes sp. NPDC051859]|uniref:asparagine synthase-related protein n=1 Tax=Actinoplanes sp. NPDC051859 TaxID=3363909 RepID=UPI0037A2AFB9